MRELRSEIASIPRGRSGRSHTVCGRGKAALSIKIRSRSGVVQRKTYMPASWARRNKSMKRIGWTTGKTNKFGKVSSAVAAALFLVLAMAHPVRTWAQAGASIHGHVINPAGMALNKGEVRLSTDRSADAKDRKYQYTFPIDA